MIERIACFHSSVTKLGDVRGRKLQGGKNVVVEAIDAGRLRLDLDEIVDRLPRGGARHHRPEGSGILMRATGLRPVTPARMCRDPRARGSRH